VAVTRPWQVWLAVVLAAGLATTATAQPGSGARLDDVTLVREPAALLVKVRTSHRPRYTSHIIGSPPRVIVDFADTRYAWRPEPWAVSEPPVKEIRGSQFRRGIARLVVELTDRVDVRIAPRPDGVQIVVPRVAAPPAAGRVGPLGTSVAPDPPDVPASATGAATDATPNASLAPSSGGRRPTSGPGSRTGAESAPATSGAASGPFRLQGIVVVDGVAVAYIEESPARPARGYRVGDAISDGRIEAISPDTVVIRRPGGGVELKIATPAGAPAKP
jgi:hypothetical protein